MHALRRSAERGHADLGWLDTRHSFSFGHYYDPRHTGFAALRVINEDVIRGGGGFAPHGHANMEIVTYVISGQLAHRDSLGNTGIIRPGEIQRMSAGRGIQHSEMNPSPSNSVHLLQIWLTPEVHDTPPDYAHETLDPSSLRNQWGLIAAPRGEAQVGMVGLRLDARIHAVRCDQSTSLSHPLTHARAWLQVIEGEARHDDLLVHPGDGLALSGLERLELDASADFHALLFELS